MSAPGDGGGAGSAKAKITESGNTVGSVTGGTATQAVCCVADSCYSMSSIGTCISINGIPYDDATCGAYDATGYGNACSDTRPASEMPSAAATGGTTSGLSIDSFTLGGHSDAFTALNGEMLPMYFKVSNNGGTTADVVVKVTANGKPAALFIDNVAYADIGEGIVPGQAIHTTGHNVELRLLYIESVLVNGQNTITLTVASQSTGAIIVSKSITMTYTKT